MSAVAYESLYTHGFARVAAAVPHLKPADPTFNGERTLGLIRRAAERHAALVVFPELGLSGYAIDDLLQQDALNDAVELALGEIVAASRELAPVIIVGGPLRAQGGLFNTGFVIHRGRILGAVPKSYLPEYREYYEERQFRAAREFVGADVEILGQTVPFGNDLVFEASDLVGFAIHAEVCEDVWVPVPPSTFGALAGATILANLSASNITIGKADFRRTLCAAQSGRCIASYIYTAAGQGESTNDLAWDGQAMIFENGDNVAEAERFAEDEQLLFADLDLHRMLSDRSSTNSYGDSIHDHRERIAAFRHVRFELGARPEQLALERTIERFPYVPADAKTRDERCYEVYNIQVHGLEQRLRATGIKKAVIGVSGGLDSTHALIVIARAMDRLGLPRENILAYTMPGFATSDHTKGNAWKLMEALGVTAKEIDITASAQQMLADLEHPYSRGEKVYDITFENVQAGERTSHLFRLANYQGGLVIGTGDLSELALGWSTYGVGDQMSHYAVNASVPKTLISFMLRWAIDTHQFGDDVNVVLQSVLDTEISPELIPGDGDKPTADSESKVGPYELQDFFLFYILRFGYRPSKVAFMAEHAWGEKYSRADIKHWLEVFLDRFFRLSQFKRTAIPNAPKVGSGGSLSPRGDWRAPSDATGAAWLEELRRNVP
ncbi:NAD(+) synthase [Solirubrobacter phytolaccae]|uniref:Glutamine-dependent NAD(+) synthetase n=1 Tax=Solirubrobacter phytolaccae TaxID=1404360 RepID=A0A9X3NBK2_9ACTN|nr:NAD(+) synthase [Solirubrobacter phytolaccae]MDA0182094.1 NAD(+) synthase [Solirubrobacter phytolaccae]